MGLKTNNMNFVHNKQLLSTTYFLCAIIHWSTCVNVSKKSWPHPSFRLRDIAPEKNIYADNHHDKLMGDSSTQLGNILPNLLAVLHHLMMTQHHLIDTSKIEWKSISCHFIVSMFKCTPDKLDGWQLHSTWQYTIKSFSSLASLSDDTTSLNWYKQDWMKKHIMSPCCFHV